MIIYFQVTDNRKRRPFERVARNFHFSFVS